jgi:hypothetical protein
MKKAFYLLVGLIGLAGLVVVLTVTCIKSYISQGNWFMLLLLAAVSMLLIGIGISGFDRQILLNRFPSTPEGRAKFISESLNKKDSWFRKFYFKHLS